MTHDSKILPPKSISPRSFRLRWTPQTAGTLLAVLVGVIVVIAVMIYMLKAATAPELGLADKTRTVSECIDRLSSRVKTPNSENELGAALQICYSIVSTSLLAEEQENRNGNLLLQRSENVVLMWMVVVITVSGVFLAGLQLWASFELARNGQADLSAGGSLNVTKSSVVVQSSVIGVIILSISFAFFMVFVIEVYKIDQIPRSSEPSQSSSTPYSNAGIGQKTQPPVSTKK
jgi:hypothetical protein